MSTLNIHLDTGANLRTGFTEAGELAVAAKGREAVPALYFRSYEDLHRVLTPSRLRVVMALAGQGVMSIDELAHRVGRDAPAVHQDVITLADAGVIDHTEKGAEFPYRGIHLDFWLDLSDGNMQRHEQ
ncbi:transcriptional regulator [Paracoccus kondratievae]|uniref:HVO_A0114 family putative DNA-binding protein n=1 Tax=Paracoccus kondratievae TaxID=135740 RepID=UPI001266119C|nr:transcriptional regulator [Paracoccus kondratievae]QFQ89114.1 transcriptional regulator [Paracoccus kondratievae]